MFTLKWLMAMVVLTGIWLNCVKVMATIGVDFRGQPGHATSIIRKCLWFHHLLPQFSPNSLVAPQIFFTSERQWRWHHLLGSCRCDWCLDSTRLQSMKSSCRNFSCRCYSSLLTGFPKTSVCIRYTGTRLALEKQIQPSFTRSAAVSHGLLTRPRQQHTYFAKSKSTWGP